MCLSELWELPHPWACAAVRPCHRTGMDTSTTPYISPVLDPETMTALMLRYALSREDVAHQYARALIRRLCADVGPHEVFQLTRDIATEISNDVEDFEGEEVDADSRALLYRFIWPY